MGFHHIATILVSRHRKQSVVNLMLVMSSRDAARESSGYSFTATCLSNTSSYMKPLPYAFMLAYRVLSVFIATTANQTLVFMTGLEPAHRCFRRRFPYRNHEPPAPLGDATRALRRAGKETDGRAFMLTCCFHAPMRFRPGVVSRPGADSMYGHRILVFMTGLEPARQRYRRRFPYWNHELPWHSINAHRSAVQASVLMFIPPVAL
jgi:hypothetical protein